MTNQLRRHRIAAGALAALLGATGTLAGSLATASGAMAQAGGTPGATSTAPPPQADQAGLNWIKRESNRLIERRVGSLQFALRVIAAKSFLGSDQAALETNLNADISGLQALDAKIQADTTLQQALADRAQILTGFRVYLLVLPVVNLVIETDFITNVEIPAVNADIAQIQALVNTTNQVVLEPLITDMQNQVSIATTATSGLSAQLLAYTPAEWNANHRLLANAYVDVRTANRAMLQANVDLKRAERYLGHGLGHRR
jgi:hypothetical protein